MQRSLYKPLARWTAALGLACCAFLWLTELDTTTAWLPFGPLTLSAQAQTPVADQPSAQFDPWQSPAASSGLGPAESPTAVQRPTMILADSSTVSHGDVDYYDSGAAAATENHHAEPALALAAQPREPAALDSAHVKQTNPIARKHQAALVWIIPEAVNLGQEANCRLVITNTAEDGASAVAVQVKVPENAQLGQCDPPPSGSGQVGVDQPLIWELGPMAPGMSKTIHVGLTPTAPGRFTPAAALAVTRISEASASILEPRVELAVVGPAQAVVGQAAAYLVSVSNHGTGAAANVQVMAQMTAGLSPPPGTQLQYQIGTLAAGESRQIELPARGIEEGRQEIVAAVQVGRELAARNNHLVQIIRPALSLSIDGPKLRYLDRHATYVINVENPSPIPIQNVQVFHRVPAGFRFVEATDGGSFDSAVRQVAWFVGRLEPHGTATVSAKLIPATVGDHTLAAAVRADAGVTGQTETATRVEGVSSVVIDVSDRDDPVEVAGETAYVIRVSNQGSKPASNVQVAAVLPAQMEFVSAEGPTDGNQEGERVIFEPLASLAPGQTQQYQVHVICRQPGSTRFRAFLRTAETTEPVIEEEQTRVYAD